MYIQIQLQKDYNEYITAIYIRLDKILNAWLDI
jgi:hypothetical protein